MKTKTKTENAELKVLVLEDSPRDMELMREQLSNAGYRLDLTHVENEAGFTAALRENSFDIILSDFKLPDFDAFGALEISRKLCPETPFICISGIIGEETAVELLKLGAIDYVLKDKPERLPFAVKRALEEAKVKADYQKAVEVLRRSEEKFRSLIESSNDGICLQDIQGKIIFANKRKLELLGYHNEEQLLGTNVFDLLKVSDQQRFKELIPVLMEKGFLNNIEAEVIKHDGSFLAVNLNFRLIRDDNGDP